jgi:hypothetical protein
MWKFEDGHNTAIPVGREEIAATLGNKSNLIAACKYLNVVQSYG